MADMIRTDKLVSRYNSGEEELTVLHGLDLSIEKGSLVAILGHNGSGKSTLVRHFNAIALPDGGKVYVRSMDTSDEEKLMDIRRTVGLVFQNPDNQIVASVVEDDVAFAPENLGLPSKEIRRRVDAALKAVDMYGFRDRAPHLLSGGQKQRVAIAGILAMEPECIVLDEPTAMLDPRGRREVLTAVKRLCRENGITVVLITHHMREAIDADRILVLSEGRLAMQGTPQEVFSRVEELKNLGLTVPETTELIYRLNKGGFGLPLDALSTDQCADAIAAALKGN
ncbi:MAG: energy-coupling factor transporter ATPase [Candidatus Heteroscillospira sp.]